MKKIIVTCLAVVGCVIGLTALKCVDTEKVDKNISYAGSLNEIEQRSQTNGIMSATELYCSNEELIALSKAIVKGKMIKLLGSYDFTFFDDESGEEVTTERYLYEFEVSEVLKGNVANDMKISVSSFIDESKYNVGEEYIWCLERIVGDYENAYNCISYTQSLFQINGDQMMRNGDKNSTITIDEFKELIKSSDDETSFREDEHSAYRTIIDSEAHQKLYE